MTATDRTPSSPGQGLDVEHDPFAGPALERVIPLTQAQQEIWLAVQLSKDAALAYS